MIDLDPRLNSNREGRSNKNLLSSFQGTANVNYEENIGFACDYNLPIPANTSHYYSRCFMGNSRPVDATNEEVLARIYDYTWEYPTAEAFARSDNSYNYTVDESISGKETISRW